MTQYNVLNVKLSNSQLDKLKSGIKSRTEFPMKFSSDLRKAFENGSSANIKLSKTQCIK